MITLASGGEKCTAFSTSSASRWVRSATALPSTASRSSTANTTRSRSSVSAMAARTTSTSSTGRPQVRGGSSPDSTSRLSALRRIRVARWSRRNRSASASGSFSCSSSWLMRPSCRYIRLWLRLARLTSRSAVNLRRVISVSASCLVSRSDFCCSVSVFCQNTTTPTQAASTATPWMADQVQGLVCPAGWLKIRLDCHTEPIPWLATVKAMFHRNGTQSW
jgi:hypothetical protein